MHRRLTCRSNGRSKDTGDLDRQAPPPAT
uniref:Uncharacterized protein n=1 Tax=Arundo donax TaxID=35708 RepID=A0A0A9AZD4_ARUDO